MTRSGNRPEAGLVVVEQSHRGVGAAVEQLVHVDLVALGRRSHGWVQVDAEDLLHHLEQRGPGPVSRLNVAWWTSAASAWRGVSRPRTSSRPAGRSSVSMVRPEAAANR